MKMKKSTREKIIGYLFVLPAVIYLLALIGYPIVYNWIIALQDVTATTLGSTSRDFIGFENFRKIFGDPVFLKAIIQTFYYTFFSLIFQFSFGFLFALFFAKQFTLSKPIRGLLVISWMLPVTVTALVFKFMFAEGNGIINTILLNLNLIKEPIGWLIEKGTSMWALIIANAWIGIPFNMLLLTTGLTNIPGDIYEASSIDGANIFQRFFKITLPLLKPTIMSVLVLGFVYTFKVFDLVYVMTGGGPVDATEVMSSYSYKLSFLQFQFGKGAAAANILFLFLLGIGCIYLKTISKEEVI